MSPLYSPLSLFCFSFLFYPSSSSSNGHSRLNYKDHREKYLTTPDCSKPEAKCITGYEACCPFLDTGVYFSSPTNKRIVSYNSETGGFDLFLEASSAPVSEGSTNSLVDNLTGYLSSSEGSQPNFIVLDDGSTLFPSTRGGAVIVSQLGVAQRFFEDGSTMTDITKARLGPDGLLYFHYSLDGYAYVSWYKQDGEFIGEHEINFPAFYYAIDMTLKFKETQGLTVVHLWSLCNGKSPIDSTVSVGNINCLVSPSSPPLASPSTEDTSH